MPGKKHGNRVPANIDDPNMGRNRVPSSFELITLQNLHVENREMASNVEKKLSKARVAHEGILSRHKALLDELEGVKSEIMASDRFITVLEQQQALLAKDNNQLMGLIHPIRRCPEEIIRYIFEISVESEETTAEKMCTAIRLSSVCRTWRSVALQTRSLWIHLVVDVKDDIRDSSIWMRQVSRRIGSTPMDIVLWLTRKPDVTVSSLLKSIELVKVKSIASLTIEFKTSGDEGLLALPALRYLGSLGSLTINSWHPTPGITPEAATWDFSSLPSKFPQSKRLTLRGFVEVSTEIQTTFNSLQTLELIEVETFDYGILPQLKNLERLVLSDVKSWVEDIPDEILLEHLHVLEISRTTFPWRVINAPQLQNLAFDSESESENSAPFVCRHPSISELEAWIDKKSFKQIAPALKGLESLNMSGFMEGLFEWEKHGLKSPPFPRLTTLKITIPDEEELTLKEFENLVKGRCSYVSSAARGYKGLAQFKKLAILDYTEQIRRAAWPPRGFTDHCIEIVSPSGGLEGKPVTEVKYTWA